MPDFDEYFVGLLAALIHLRIFEFDEQCPIVDVHSFIMEVSDRVPHLEYISMPSLNHHYKRVGGELVICDWKERPRFELREHVRVLYRG
jgi:hypothetical protein